MEKGTVKFFNKEKKYGFIIPEGKEDIKENNVFVHISNIQGGEDLSENDTVEFETEIGKKGANALNVKKV